MATKIIDTIKVVLDDGTELLCRPLKIKFLRKFMERISDLEGLESDNLGTLSVLIECCEIALEQYAPGKHTTEQLEELLDLPTIYKIIEGASGIVLGSNDDSPNQ